MGAYDLLRVVESYKNSITKLRVEEKPKFKTLNLKYIDDYLSSLIDMLKGSNFTQVVITGHQGSGKTTTAYTITRHLIPHLNNPAVAKVNALALTLQQIEGIKARFNSDDLILILDDISYVFGAMGRKESSLLKNLIATIRHVFQGRVVLIVITHVEKGIPPILRNSNMWVYQSITRESEIKKANHRYLRILQAFNSQKTNVVESGGVQIRKDSGNRVVYLQWEGREGLAQVRLTTKGDIEQVLGKELYEITEYSSVRGGEE